MIKKKSCYLTREWGLGQSPPFNVGSAYQVVKADSKHMPGCKQSNPHAIRGPSLPQNGCEPELLASVFSAAGLVGHE